MIAWLLESLPDVAVTVTVLFPGGVPMVGVGVPLVLQDGRNTSIPNRVNTIIMPAILRRRDPPTINANPGMPSPNPRNSRGNRRNAGVGVGLAVVVMVNETVAPLAPCNGTEFDGANAHVVAVGSPVQESEMLFVYSGRGVNTTL